MATKKIVFGKKNLLVGDLEPKNETVRISMMMEGDLLDAIKAQAKIDGIGYQTLLKNHLRAIFLGEGPSIGINVLSPEKIDATLSDIQKRMEILEGRAFVRSVEKRKRA